MQFQIIGMFDKLPSYKFRLENHRLDFPNTDHYYPYMIGYCLEPEYQSSHPAAAIMYDDGTWSHVNYYRIVHILEELDRYEEALYIEEFYIF